MLKLRELGPGDWRDFRDLRLQALAEAPYAFGSTFADWRDAAEERWRGRLTAVAYNVIAEFDGRPAGMAGGSLEEDGPAELISMWVAPFARGRGVGGALIAAVAEWAAVVRPGELLLQVVDGNEHAIRLYEKNGFVDRGVVAGTDPIERLMSRPI
jgi:GNAT superfamily N-acetyltransferase